MKTARQVLEAKPNQAIFSIPPSATVYAALQLMVEKSVGALLVMEHGKPIVTGTPEQVRSDERVIKAYLGEE